MKTAHGFIWACFLLSACSSGGSRRMDDGSKTGQKGTFSYDLAFLKKHDDVTVLSSADRMAQVIVSAKYQGKVFTSTVDGGAGKSLGWVNHAAFDGPPNEHMNAYGGENRLWLGPEGAQFSLFFKPGATMDLSAWHTPAAFDTEPWQKVSQTERAVVLSKDMSLINYAGTRLRLKIDRHIRLLNRAEVATRLGSAVGKDVKSVAFSTENTLTNTGDHAWNQQTGAPCLWLLDMFVPSPGVTVIIPYDETASGRVATTDYFGPIPESRVNAQKGILYFKADGRSRGKLGLTPQRAKPMAGSYDATNNILTLITFDIDKNATYLNQAWKLVPDPLIGDAVNAYNDGPLADGSQMGPFYEMESVSPAAFLKPGQKLAHRHNVFHFTGDKAQLDAMARHILGVSLASIQQQFGAR